VCLCVLCGSENKERLFPYTALTDWFVYQRRSVFTARYELNVYTYMSFWLIFPCQYHSTNAPRSPVISTLLLPQGQTAEVWEPYKSSGLSETGQHWIDIAFRLSFRGLTQVDGRAVIIGHVCSVSLNHVLDCTLTIC